MSTPPLSLVRPGDRPPSPHVSAVPVPPSRVRLLPWPRVAVEQARKFLMDLEEATDGADLPKSMYLLGLLEGHALTLLDVIDAVTEVG